MALRIEKAFDVSMDMLLRMQAWYDASQMHAQANEVRVRRYVPAGPETAFLLPEPQSVPRVCELYAWLAHTEELLDRQAVEVSGCHGPRGGKNFIKPLKPGWLGGHGGTPALLYVRERSGIMACRGAAGEEVNHA